MFDKISYFFIKIIDNPNEPFSRFPLDYRDSTV